MTEITIKKAECSKCGGLRNCEIVGQHKDRHSDGDDSYSYDWCVEWNILKCAGCDHVFVQTVSTNSEDYDQEYDHYGDTVTIANETIDYWPALSKRKRPDWFDNFLFIDVDDVDRSKLFDRLSASLKEVYGALDGGLNMLAGIGIRTTFDIASELLDIDPNASFTDKVDAIVKAGGIGKVQREHLETMIEAGNASAHRGWVPTVEQLDTLMEILENFIAEAFVHPEEDRVRSARVAKVKGEVPSRVPRRKKKSVKAKVEKAIN